MGNGLVRAWWPGPDQQWRRNQYVSVASLFVAFLGFSFASPFLPLYLLELDIPTMEEASFWSGVSFGVSPLISAMLAPFWGSVADRFSKKLLVLRCLIAFTVLLALMAFVTHMWQLLALRIILGFFGGFTTLATIMVMSYAPPDRTAEAVGFVQAAQIIGQGIGPVFGGITADMVGLRPSFVAAAVACAIAAVILTVFLKEEKVAARRQRAKGSLSIRQVLLLANMLALMVVLFGARFVERTFDPVMPLFVSQLDVDPGWIATGVGLITGLSTVGRAISSTLAGGSSSRGWSRRTLLLISLGASAVACLPMALATAFWQMLILRAIEGFLSGGLLTLAIATGADLIPRQQRGAGVGLLMSGGMYGSAVAPMVAGAIGAVNLRAVFVLDAAIFAALTIATLVFMRELAVESVAAVGMEDASPTVEKWRET
ncbi:MAG: MFS transporter [Actinobacteria bacterium]|nr:MFS transporter [Actinomycetota bacterium]MCL5025486.1 MFS transporter [Chloroflexota bacterium]